MKSGMLKCARACLVALALASPYAAGSAGAAGLGRLTVESIQGQPFKAEIDLVAVKKEEKSLLTARLASQEAFRQASVDYLPILSTFQATIETRADGVPYVRIVSPLAVNEPLLNILVELNWPSGRLLREYTVVLSHTEHAHAEHDASATVKQAASSSPAGSTKAESAFGKSRATAGQVSKMPLDANPVSAAPANSASYGPVKEGDTLREIAKNVTGVRGASTNQVLIALQRANPAAFVGDNVHQLKAGATLRIPDGNEIRAIQPAEADKALRMQTADWRQRRFLLIAEPPEDLKQTVTGPIDRTAKQDAVPVPEAAAEVLRLSKGAAPRNQDQESANHAAATREKKTDPHTQAQDHLQAMEEDATARDRALREANERIALLEKNIRELQRLLELKNVALAEMQRRAEGAQPESTAQFADVPQPQTDPRTAHLAGGGAEAAWQSSEKGEIPLPERTDTTQTALSESDAPERVELAKPVRLTKLAEEAGLSNTDMGARGKVSFLDDMMVNFEYLGSALVLLLTGIVGVSMVRGSKSSSVFEADYEDFARPSALPLRESASSIVRKSESAAMNSGADSIRQDEVLESQPHPISGRTGVELTALHAGFEAAAEPASSERETERDTGASLSVAEAGLEATAKPFPVEYETEWDADWHETLTKLDLARAYQEMDDKESARQVLEEVIREGDKRQREYASAILNKL